MLPGPLPWGSATESTGQIANQWAAQYVIRWILIYPVEGVIQPLSNLAQAHAQAKSVLIM